MNFEDFNWDGLAFPTTYIKSVFDFCRTGGFKRGLEVGFDSGSSALAFLRACPEATLTSIDISSCEAGNAVLAQSGASERHTFIHADSRIYLPEWLKRLNENEKFDYIFIDGDHDYDPAAQDLANAINFLADGGTILVDDCDPNHAHFGVYRAVRDFLSTHTDFTGYPLPENPNSAFVIKKI